MLESQVQFSTFVLLFFLPLIPFCLFVVLPGYFAFFHSVLISSFCTVCTNPSHWSTPPSVLLVLANISRSDCAGRRAMYLHGVRWYVLGFGRRSKLHGKFREYQKRVRPSELLLRPPLPPTNAIETRTPRSASPVRMNILTGLSAEGHASC